MDDDQQSRSTLKSLLQDIIDLKEKKKQGIEVSFDDTKLPVNYVHLIEYKKYGQEVYLDILYVTFAKKYKRMFARHTQHSKKRHKVVEKRENIIMFPDDQMVVNK